MVFVSTASITVSHNSWDIDKNIKLNNYLNI